MIDFTKGTGMAEDYREVGWPKKQVERLDAQIEELSREINDRLDVLRGRVVGLGNGASHLSVRLAKVESRLSKNGEPIETWTSRQLEKMGSSLRGMERQFNADSEEIGVLHEALRNQAHRFEAIESKLNLANEQNDDSMDRLGSKVAGLEQADERKGNRLAFLIGRISQLEIALTNYGIPIEGGSTQLITNSEPPRMAMEGPQTKCPGVPHRGHTKSDTNCPLDPPTDRQEAYERGFSAGMQYQAPRSFKAGQEVGRAAAVLDAEARVREYMTGLFATATVEAVVGLIRQGYQPKNSD